MNIGNISGETQGVGTAVKTICSNAAQDNLITNNLDETDMKELQLFKRSKSYDRMWDYLQNIRFSTNTEACMEQLKNNIPDCYEIKTWLIGVVFIEHKETGLRNVYNVIEKKIIFDEDCKFAGPIHCNYDYNTGLYHPYNIWTALPLFTDGVEEIVRLKDVDEDVSNDKLYRVKYNGRNYYYDAEMFEFFNYKKHISF